jgi:septal ring factor EnvC (AmiA/AmiB activator)
MRPRTSSRLSSKSETRPWVSFVRFWAAAGDTSYTYDAVMEVTPEKVAEFEQQLEELTKKAEETDQRTAELKQDVQQVKERADKIQRRLKRS